MTFNNIISKLKSNKPFSFSRTGDGEWFAILGKEGKNTDGHKYYPDMGAHLKIILETGGNGELFGLQQHALKNKDLTTNPEFQRLVKDTKWDGISEVFSRNHKRQPEFLEALEGRDVILVGNTFMQIDTHIDSKSFTHISIPLVNCWQAHHLTHTELQDTITPGCVVLYCASMMANVLINWIYRDDITQIDIGSWFDPLVKRYTRKYMRDLYNASKPQR